MQPDRVGVMATAAIVVVLALATGPLVGVLAVPKGGLGGGATPGSGSADVAVVSAPDGAVLEAGEYGELHYLTVPATTVSVSNVSGAPLLTASLDIDEIGWSRSSVFRLSPSNDGTRTYRLEGGSVESADLDRGSYDGRLRFVLRDDDGRTVIYDEPIVVEVTG